MKIFKFFGKCLLAFLFLIIIFWTILLGLLQTQSGQQWAFNQVLHYLEQTTQTEIQVKNIHFSFPLNLSLEEITILKENHPLVTIQNIDIDCAYIKLLQGRIVFSKLQAFGINIFQLPACTNSISTFPSLSWNAPLFPFYVKIENLDIQNIKFNPFAMDSLKLPRELDEYIGQTAINLQGLISHNPFKSSLTTHLLITAKNDQTGFTPFNLGLDIQNHQLSISFHFNQLPLHLLQLNLPSHLKSHLALYASAPISTWQNLVENRSQQNVPIEGLFKFSLQSTSKDSSALSELIEQPIVMRSQYLLKSKNEIEFVDLKIGHPNFFLQGNAIMNANQEIHHGHFKGEINNLENFQRWIGKNIQGKVVFEGDAKGPLQSPSIILHLTSPGLWMTQQFFQNIQSSLQASFQNQEWNGFLNLNFDHQKIPWKASSSFNWNHQQFTLSHLQVDAVHSHLKGKISGSAPHFILEGFLETQSSDLNEISHFLANPVSGEGKFKVQLSEVIDIHQKKKQGFQVEFAGQSLSWMDGQAQQLILHLQTEFEKEGEDSLHIRTSLEGQNVKWKDYFVGQCTADSVQFINGTHRELNHLSVEWKAQQLEWVKGKAAEAAGRVDLKNPLENPEGTIQFAIHEIQTPEGSLEELIGSTTLVSKNLRWPFHLKGKGMWKEDLIFDTEGNWHYQKDKMEIQIQHLSGRFGPYPLQLKQPLYFLQYIHEIQLSGLWLQWGEAELQASFYRDHQKIFSHFKTNAVPSELFHFIEPDLPVTGRATFQGHLEGSLHQPKGQMQIDLHHMQIIEDIFTQKPFVTGKIVLNLEEKGIQLNSELNGIGHTPLRVSGLLPFHFNWNPLTFKVEPHLPFELALNAEGELDPYLHLFYHDTLHLSGYVKIALQLSGKMNAPQIKGNIDLLNGTYESLSAGTLYHNIQAHLEGEGSQVILKKFSAQDNKNGLITATGTIHLDANKSFPFEFSIHPARIFIVDSDYVDISASGSLTWSGNKKKSKLQGVLTVDQANIHLEEALPHQIKNIDIKYINLTQGEQPVPNYFEKKESVSAIDLEVKLNAPQNVHIEGKHLKSEWKGNLLIKGTPGNPQLYGDLRIAQGEYDFNGKVFNLNQGNIHFGGAPDKKTSLYIVASKDIDRITAEIIVKGQTNKPVISFRSNPPLSQREVLSYILFNRGISDITADQGDQLSQSFISLNSSEQTKRGDNFLSRLRNKIGIDRLDFTTNENKDFGFQVGKHITENVMLSINKNMSSLSPIISVEAKLHKNLKAQAEAGVGEDAPIRMFIKWKKDY